MAQIQDGLLQLKHIGNGFIIDEANKKIHVSERATGNPPNTFVDGGSFTSTSLDLTRTDGAVVSIALPENNCVQKIHDMTSAGTLPVGHDIYLLSEIGNYAMPPAVSVPIGTQFTLVHNVPTGGDIVIHNSGMVLTNMIAPYGGGHTLKGFNAVATVTCVSEGVYRIWGQAE